MPIEKPKVFLCYAHADHDRIETLSEKLAEADFVPWMSPKNIVPGEKWRCTLFKAIKAAPFFLACLSNNSVDRHGVIQEEIKLALYIWRQELDSDIYFIPVRLEECKVPDVLSKFQRVDLFTGGDFNWLLRSLKLGMERLGILLNP